MPVIGETTQTSGEVTTFEWKITDFFSLSDEANFCYFSPYFSFAGSSWYLGLFPNGEKAFSSVGWVGLRIIRKDSKSAPKTVYYTFGIKGSGAVERKEERKAEFPKGGCDALGIPKCWLRNELRNRRSTLMPNNVLTIVCILRSEVPFPVKGGEKALEDFSKLLASGERSDVTVKVGDVEFPVYSAILCARCPALSASLQHESKEKTSRRIVIEDCLPDVFQDFLLHLYAGSPKCLSAMNVFGLYRVADKYLVDDLKRHCLEHIRDTLSIQTFCESLKLALKHGEKGLLERAIDFATRNIQLIVCSGDWQIFIREYPTEANEIVIKSLATLRDNL